MADQTYQSNIAGLPYTWNVDLGTMEIAGFPCTAFFRDTSLASLLLGFQTMVGAERFSLAQQAEGQKGIEGDWSVISAAPTFEQGFENLAVFAASAGWGRWKLTHVDREKKEMRVEVTNSWEGAIQRSLKVAWGSGLIAGKFSGFAQRLFGVTCRTEQVKSWAKGDAIDAFVIRPSATSIDEDVRRISQTEHATSADLARALAELREAAAEREKLLAERDQNVSDLQEQRERIRELSSPILEIWENVLAVPLVGAVDQERASDLMEKLLEQIVRRKSRYAILDLTGVDTIDTATANNLIRVVGAIRLLGAHGVVTGINPQVAHSVAAVGVDLSKIATFGTMRDALRWCMNEMSEADGTSGGRR